MFAVSVTGHRPNKLFGYDIHLPVYQPIRDFIRKQLIEFIEKHKEITTNSGGALGIDQIFAEECIKLKKDGYAITNILASPCVGQEKQWPYSSQQLYRAIVKEMDEIHPGAPEYNKTCMQERNIWMVDNANIIMAFWDGTSGGTGNCVRYAKSQGKDLIIYAPKTGKVEFEIKKRETEQLSLF